MAVRRAAKTSRFSSVALGAALLGLPLLFQTGEPPTPPGVFARARLSYTAGGRERTVADEGPVAALCGRGAGVRVSVWSEPPDDPSWTAVSSEHWLMGPDGELRSVEPGKAVAVRAPMKPGTTECRVRAAWRLRCNGPGEYAGMESVVSSEISVFLCTPVPSSEIEGEYLRGYRVGDYSKLPETPASFIEAPKAARDAKVTENLRLAEFLSSETATTMGDWPKYAPIPWALLDKIEALNDELRRLGYVHHTITCYSGYRTPHYNALIHGATRSQHMQGKAMDFIVDKNDDGDMDDLDGDGDCDIHDAIIVGNILRRLENEGKVVPGGTGVYELVWPTDPKSPIRSNLHLDVRGAQASWGRHYASPIAVEYTEIPW